MRSATKSQATIWATIISAIPGIVTALTTDPRTDNDTATAYGNLTNAPIGWTLFCTYDLSHISSRYVT
jgi:hypothetical protein